jgi:hypothetical protein
MLGLKSMALESVTTWEAVTWESLTLARTSLALSAVAEQVAEEVLDLLCDVSREAVAVVTAVVAWSASVVVPRRTRLPDVSRSGGGPADWSGGLRRGVTQG